MKNLILIMIVLISSCSKNETIEQEDELKGTWKLIERYGSDAGNISQWHPVENGYTYTFNSNGTYSSTRFSECSTGDYTFTASTLTLAYDCENFNTGIENSPEAFIENYVFENRKIILTPTYLNCDEGCSYKFRKIMQ